jgi:hypothetical protein
MLFDFEVSKVIISKNKKYITHWSNELTDRLDFYKDMKDVNVNVNTKTFYEEYFEEFKKFWRKFKKIVDNNKNIISFSINFMRTHEISEISKEIKMLLKHNNFLDFDFTFPNLEIISINSESMVLSDKIVTRFLMKHNKLTKITVTFDKMSFDRCKIFCKYLITNENLSYFCTIWHNTFFNGKLLLLLLLVLHCNYQIFDKINFKYFRGNLNEHDSNILKIIDDYYNGTFRKYYIDDDDIRIVNIDNILRFLILLRGNVTYGFLFVIKVFI